jgi:hypothetical protein
MSVSSSAGLRPTPLPRIALSEPVAALRKTVYLAHALSLDAVAVAVVWQDALSRALGAAPTISERIALALAVWVVYLVDRQLDVRAQPDGGCRTLRHRLHRRQTRTLSLLAVIGFVALALAAWRVPTRTVVAGSGLAAITLTYLVAVQRSPRLLAWGAKEACVGAVFAMGCAIHIPLATPHLPIALLATAALFTLNCLMISNWERHLDSPTHRLAPASPTTPTRPNPTALAALLLAAASTTTAFSLGYPFHPAILNCISLSAILLAGVDALARRRYSTSLRVAADLVLLTPLLLPW